jgi:hypothetical protein
MTAGDSTTTQRRLVRVVLLRRLAGGRRLVALRVGQHAAAPAGLPGDGGLGLLLRVVGRDGGRRRGPGDLRQLKARLAGEQLLDPLRVALARHLQENLVRPRRAVLLQGRLGDADGVDAAVDDLHRLIDGLIAEHALRVPRHRPRDRVARNAGRVGAEIDLALQLVAHLARLRGVGHGDDEVVPVGRRVNVGPHVLQLEAGRLGGLLRGEHVVLRQALEVLRHLHLHDEVRAAAQVEAEADVLAQGLLDALPREVRELRPAARADDGVERRHGDRGDDDEAEGQILSHD